MNKHITEQSNCHGGLFALWELLSGQGLKLSRNKVKATIGCTKAEKIKDCE